MENNILKAVHSLKQGKVIAYPTEAVYGLGCDPFNLEAVIQLLHIKQRHQDKGLILVASNWQQIDNLIKPIPTSAKMIVELSWPGPVTWVFPASQQVPAWIKGRYDSIALRISAHPIIQQLCQEFSGPIVSTSANSEGQPPARDAYTVSLLFSEQLGCIIEGALGELSRPTEIRDVLSGEIIRSG